MFIYILYRFYNIQKYFFLYLFVYPMITYIRVLIFGDLNLYITLLSVFYPVNVRIHDDLLRITFLACGLYRPIVHNDTDHMQCFVIEPFIRYSAMFYIFLGCIRLTGLLRNTQPNGFDLSKLVF